jgi:hypothetical protein
MLMSGKLSEKRLPDVAGYHTATEVGRTSLSLSLSLSLSATLLALSSSRNRIGTFVSFRLIPRSRSESTCAPASIRCAYGCRRVFKRRGNWWRRLSAINAKSTNRCNPDHEWPPLPASVSVTPVPLRWHEDETELARKRMSCVSSTSVNDFYP